MMVRTPRERRAAMLAREGTSCGAREWCVPWRARMAIAVGGGASLDVEVEEEEEGVW